jgi:hypothetical protein
MVSLPSGLAEDTIYLSDASEGVVGLYYDSDLSFRMPKTTTPVAATDPGTPPGLDISEITITSVTNLPPGLSWEANQTVFDPDQETDGCGKICGVPLLPGLYNVNVIVTAQVLIVEEVSSFSFPILILPGSSVTDGFTLENGVGCGSVAPSIINNIASGGMDGFEYMWDFGNNQTSTAENPEVPLYNEPGVYPITYQAIVDTFGYLLQEVTVEDVGCGDILGGAPDLMVDIYNPAGEKIFTSEVVENTDPPVTFGINLFLEEGLYELRVIDDDQGIDGGDDGCGSIFFTLESDGTFTSGALTASLTILHPIDTIQSTDTVFVYEQPEAPELFGVPEASICEGEVVTLFTQYDSLTQWYQDTMPMLNETGALINVSESGVYWVSYTTPEGCSATSDTAQLVFSENPTGPVFQNFDNLLVLFDPDALPESFLLQWYLEEDPIENANDLQYCIEKDGTYTLEVIDQATNCTASYTLTVEYNPAFPNCMPSSTEDFSDDYQWMIFPNPAKEQITVSASVPAGPVVFSIYAINGSLQHQWVNDTSINGDLTETISISHLPKGMYLFELRTQEGRHVQKLLIQ